MASPPSRQRLLTLVQISDLHLGEIGPGTGDHPLDAADQEFCARWPHSGFLGHGGQALVLLSRFWNSLAPENPLLVTTGDLTAHGADRHHALARTFLTGRLPLRTAMPTGLGCADALRRAIPGNHDHWPGVVPATRLSLPFWGDPTQGFTAQGFDQLPAIERLALGNASRMMLLRIDSDADVRPQRPSTERACGRGRFSSHLQELERLLPAKSEPNTLRVLLIHHSLHHHAPTFLGMDGSVRIDLEEFLARHRIHVMLTGHVHQPIVHPHSVGLPGALRQVVEARCGTTTQRDRLPERWYKDRPKKRAADEAKLDPNILFVHRVFADGASRVIWNTELYSRSDRGFTNQACDRMRAGTAISWEHAINLS